MDAKEFLKGLEDGQIRAAYKDENNNWVVDIKVKEKILDIFRSSNTVDMSEYQYNGFMDKNLLPPRVFSLKDDIRIVPGGSSVRSGAHIGPGSIIMPPSYVNIGAYIDDNTMIDSHVLVGSCAQIGKNVHLSAGVQIGGVLEPIGNRPVIVEDDCFIGAGVILTEGILVQTKAVLAPGLSLSASVPIYDVINKTITKGVIPANAVVISGTRPINNEWAIENRLSLDCAIIIKYRDDKTSASVVLEQAIR